jgi:hypothetical protein
MSSKRNVRRRECLRKYAYHTLNHVFEAQAWHEVTYGQSLDVYLCRWCNCWHLGHTRGEEERTRRNFKILT